MPDVIIPCQDKYERDVRFAFSKKDVIDNKQKRNNSPDDLKEVYRGTFASDTISYLAAVKEYKIKKANLNCVSVKRAIENLKFLSLPGNEHPNFIRFLVHHKKWEKIDSDEEEEGEDSEPSELEEVRLNLST